MFVSISHTSIHVTVNWKSYRPIVLFWCFCNCMLTQKQSMQLGSMKFLRKNSLQSSGVILLKDQDCLVGPPCLCTSESWNTAIFECGLQRFQQTRILESTLCTMSWCIVVVWQSLSSVCFWYSPDIHWKMAITS